MKVFICLSPGSISWAHLPNCYRPPLAPGLPLVRLTAPEYGHLRLLCKLLNPIHVMLVHVSCDKPPSEILHKQTVHRYGGS